MVSTADAPTQGLPSISKVAALLGASESEVTGLLEQGMLKGTSENRDSVGCPGQGFGVYQGVLAFRRVGYPPNARDRRVGRGAVAGG